MIEKELGKKIRLYTTKEIYSDYSNETDNPAMWRKQDFLADILLNASEQKYFAPDNEKLSQILDEFFIETKIQVDINSLFARHWLRIVADIVYIPSSISGSIYLVNKVKELKNELIFLRGLGKNKKENYSIVEFEKLLEDYESAKKIKLDIEKAMLEHLFSKDDENKTVKIANIRYYDLLVENWSDFQFIAFLHEKIHGEYSHLVISEDTLEHLYSIHSKKYALTPSLPEMLDSGLGEKTSDGYIISLFSRRYCSKDTLSETGAILWKKVVQAHNDLSHERILMIWYKKMILQSDHNFDVYKYLTKGEIDQFNRAATALIVQEVDLYASQQEYGKALLDYYQDHDLNTVQLANQQKSITFGTNSEDAFDTMRAMSNVENATVGDYLYFAQSSRKAISYFIGQIVKSHSCDDLNLDRINDLTNDIHKKPFLLWTLCFWIWEWRPELFPVLMKNLRLTSVLFSLVKKLTITPSTFEVPSEIKFNISIKLFKHLLSIIKLDDKTPRNIKAKIIYNCLMTAIAAQFDNKLHGSRFERENRSFAMKLSSNIKQEFSDTPIQSDQVKTKEKYYPELLKSIFEVATVPDKFNKHNNEVLDFNYEKLSLLLFLSELSKKTTLINQEQNISSFDLANALLDCYLKTISANSISAANNKAETSEESIPIFIPSLQNIEAIEWGTLFLLLENEELSNKFLNPPGLSFNNDGDEYDSFNRFIIAKLRTHLRVLVTTYNQLKKKESDFSHRGISIVNSFLRLQNAILDIAVPYSLNEPSKRRFDIFNPLYERPTFRTHQDELIPMIGKVSNSFPPAEREKIITSLLRTDRIIRTAKLIETMNSEQDQTLLSKCLNSYDLENELRGLFSVYDVQYLLNTLSKYSQFQEIAGMALSYWEENIVPLKADVLSNEIKITTYRTRLLLAFQANDLKAIEDVIEPEGQLYLNLTRIYVKNEKDFYKALFFYKNDEPQKAHRLYDDLLYRNDNETVVIALNRFASKIKWAEKEPDVNTKNALYTDALLEWDLYRKHLPEDVSIGHIIENLVHNQLLVFDALDRHDEFDNLYATLSYLERVKPGFFEIAVKNRIKRKMNSDALVLIKEAAQFHKLKDGVIPQFVKEMSDLALGNFDPEILKEIFPSLLIAQPDNLVKLVPDSVNSGTDVQSYILNFAVETASDMLSKINSIAEIHFEDKYSDQMIFGLNAAMKFHHWQAAPARGGFSNSDHSNPGEIDFAIYSSSSQELAIFEAFNLYGQNTTEEKKHSTKIFNYSPSKKGLFLLTYYKGKETNFLSTWEKYKTNILNIIEFPESYLLDQNGFNDLSEQYSNAAIRVGITSHGHNVKLHHIFVNINYKAVVG